MLVQLSQPKNYFPKVLLTFCTLASQFTQKMPSWLILIEAIPSRIMFKRSSSFETQHSMEEKHE